MQVKSGALTKHKSRTRKNRSAHRLSRNPSCVRQDFDGAVDVDFDNNTTQSGAADVLFFPSNWLETGETRCTQLLTTDCYAVYRAVWDWSAPTTYFQPYQSVDVVESQHEALDRRVGRIDV